MKSKAYNRAELPAYEGPIGERSDFGESREELIWRPSNDVDQENKDFSPLHSLLQTSRYKQPKENFHLKSTSEIHRTEQNFLKFGCVPDPDWFLNAEEVEEAEEPLWTRRGRQNTLIPPHDSKTVRDILLHVGQHNNIFSQFDRRECYKLPANFRNKEPTDAVCEAYWRNVKCNKRPASLATKRKVIGATDLNEDGYETSFYLASKDAPIDSVLKKSEALNSAIEVITLDDCDTNDPSHAGNHG